MKLPEGGREVTQHCSEEYGTKTSNAPQIENPKINFAYNSIREILDKARLNVVRAVNSAMVYAYWEIGKVIVEEEQNGKERAEYGAELINKLSIKLTNKYGKGFNERNLWYMKQFFLAFPNLNAVRAELSWTHYRLILKIEKESARQF